MIVTDITKDSFPSGRILGPADQSRELRSSGLHLSAIYQDMIGTLGPQRNHFSEEELGWYRAGGFLWEHVFSSAFASAISGGDVVRPGEFQVDGVIGSPDNWNLLTNRVIETKMTWRSSRKLENLEKYFWTWLVQMKGYCRMVGATEAELYVFFVNGNYAPPAPLGRALLFRWEQHEIYENWEMIKNHARNRGWLPK